MLRDASLVVDGLQLDEQLTRLRGRRRGRWIEPAQLEWVGDAGDREVEGEWREVRLEDFRCRPRDELGLLDLRPQTIARARRETAGATAALLGGRPIDAHRLEARHAGARREAWHTREPTVDDDANPIDR